MHLEIDFHLLYSHMDSETIQRAWGFCKPSWPSALHVSVMFRGAGRSSPGYTQSEELELKLKSNHRADEGASVSQEPQGIIWAKEARKERKQPFKVHLEDLVMQ